MKTRILVSTLAVAAMVLAGPLAFADTLNGNSNVTGSLDVAGTLTAPLYVMDNGSTDGANMEFRSAGRTTHFIDNSGGNFRFFSDGLINFIIRNDNKRVGIGVSGPLERLHVDGNILAKTFIMDNGLADGANMEYRSLGNVTQKIDNVNGDLRFAQGGAINMIIKGATRFVGIGTTAPATLLDVAGTATCQILQITGGADLSEQFNVQSSQDVLPGMVVSIDPQRAGQLMVSSKAYDRTVAGIVSGANGLKTGMMMGQSGTIAHGNHPVALTGRVYCMADASNGAIQPGDLLTTSALPGHAMKVSDYTQAQGAIIGKAMTALDSDTGMVLVLVSLQ